MGRYRWTRLPFGLSVSSEIFQKQLQHALQGLPGTICIADDILVYGSGDTKEQADQDHDNNVQQLLARCQEQNIQLNPEKAEVKVTRIPFQGHIITDAGILADPAKIQAITDMSPPTNVNEAQQLNGMVNYWSKYLPHLDRAMQPIRKLTYKGVP